MLKLILPISLIASSFLMMNVSALTPVPTKSKVSKKVVTKKVARKVIKKVTKKPSKKVAVAKKSKVLKKSLKKKQKTNAGNFGVSAKISTLGLGLDLTYGITDKLNGRFNINGGSLDASGEQDGINYDGNLELQSIGGILDYHPTGGEFRLSVGLYKNSNKIDVNSTGINNSDVEIGGRRYDLSKATLNTNVGFKSTAPYIGLGWGNAVDSSSKFSITTDFGILFQGQPEVKLSTTGNVIDKQTGTKADVSVLNAELAKEEENLNDSDLKKFKLLPVISLGMNYRF